MIVRVRGLLWGQGRKEKGPGRHGYFTSGQPPGADPLRRSGQLSAVCQFQSERSQQSASI